MTILVAGRQAEVHDSLPARGWSLDRKQYVIYTSRRKYGALPRGKKAHIAAIETLTGEPFPIGKHVHHQDFNKLNNCPCNLVLMDAAFNTSPTRQHPYTARWISLEEYWDITGERPRRVA